MKLNALVTALTVSLLASSCTNEDANANTSGNASATVFKFSAIPNKDNKDLREKFDPVAEYLGEKLGITVEYIPSTNYDFSVKALQNGDIQMAWLGGLTHCQARKLIDGAKAVAKGDKDQHFKSYFIVPKDSSIEKSDGFPMAAKGKRFTFGNTNSTSGRLMPQYFLEKETGMKPEEFFSEVHFTDNHPQTIALVKNGNWDMGAVDFSVYDGMVDEGKLSPEDCPIVWETPTYADYNFTVRPDLDAKYGEGFTQKLTAALLAMSPELAKGFDRNSMVPASNADFDAIYEVARQLDKLPK